MTAEAAVKEAIETLEAMKGVLSCITVGSQTPKGYVQAEFDAREPQIKALSLAISALSSSGAAERAWEAVKQINGIEKPGLPIEFMAVGENRFKARVCCAPEVSAIESEPYLAVLEAAKKLNH